MFLSCAAGLKVLQVHFQSQSRNPGRGNTAHLLQGFVCPVHIIAPINFPYIIFIGL
jgi:hypothetical protein